MTKPFRFGVVATPDGCPERWIATARRVVPLGDRVRVDAEIDGGIPIFAQFPRRSSLLRGVEPGARLGIEVTHARAWPAP